MRFAPASWRATVTLHGAEIYDLRLSPMRDDHDRIVGAAHIFRDVT